MGSLVSDNGIIYSYYFFVFCIISYDCMLYHRYVDVVCIKLNHKDEIFFHCCESAHAVLSALSS